MRRAGMHPAGGRARNVFLSRWMRATTIFPLTSHPSQAPLSSCSSQPHPSHVTPCKRPPSPRAHLPKDPLHPSRPQVLAGGLSPGPLGERVEQPRGALDRWLVLAHPRLPCVGAYGDGRHGEGGDEGEDGVVDAVRLLVRCVRWDFGDECVREGTSEMRGCEGETADMRRGEWIRSGRDADWGA